MRECGGNVALILGLIAPILALVIGASTDYAIAVNERTRAQQAVDAASLAGAKELSLADVNRENVPAIVKAVVDATYNANRQSASNTSYAVTTNIVQQSGLPLQVQVNLTGEVATKFGKVFGLGDTVLNVISVAIVVGKPNVCLLTIEQTLLPSISLQNSAKVIGQNCGVYANSRYLYAVWAQDNSLLQANVICSAGGKGGGKGNYIPEPLTDCPQFDDPLAGRPEPTPGSCVATNLVIDSQMVTLDPGTYCGGLTIKGTADVTFSAGVYIIKGGKFYVSDTASVSGDGVGFYFSGSTTSFQFDSGTSVNFSAPKSGSMAGMLFFGSRSQFLAEYKILSDNARQLLGTIYLPEGHLTIDANQPVADKSAYTALVVRRFTANAGPTVTLNTNYDETDVPVPDGIRGAGLPVALAK